ncbi:hypothetical protein CVD25_01050 [Bacillus canaveralius]|uniref:Phage portal protein n=1 Tax=Bacillus canaveralius TaxID=1403243 RepID=A0A2N5GPP9_9BACI|nr:hypothetical protein [Bacillus canaveralius]PLR84652.1 hypothetical protein CU635_06160 [Bacillus canaveralius]PLS00804.1 hypothetical protein CVD25_01050 [Bacillus canaveralius]
MQKVDESQKNLQKYLNRIEAAEKFRQGYEDLWRRCYRRWRNHKEKLIDPNTRKEVKDRSNISIPYTFVQVETILPRMVEGLFASRPYVAIKGREKMDEPNAKAHEILLDWQLGDRMDIRDIFSSGLKGLTLYGTGVAYTGWKYEEQQVIRKQMMDVVEVDENEEPIIGYDGSLQYLTDEEGEPIQELQPVKMNIVAHDDPEVKFLDLFLFFTDPHSEDIDDARYCGHIEYMTKEELQNLEKMELGHKFDWDEISNEDKLNDSKNQRMSSVGLPSASTSINSEDALYEVIHYWEDDKKVMIINRTYVAFEGENPFWHKKKPYVKDVYTEVPGEFYGMGVVEIMEDLQDELNTERNMRIDYRAFSLRRMFKVRRGSDISRSELKWRPGGIINVDNMDDVQEFKVEAGIGASFGQEDMIKQDMKDASGAHDVVMGTANTSETATTTMTKDNNASVRFKHIISSIENRLLTGIARHIIQLNQQFIDDEKILRVAGQNGDDWVTISPEEIQGEFDLVPMGTSVEPLANKEAFKQRMIELYNVIAGDAMMIQFPDKRRNLLKKVLEAFDIKDTETLLPSDEELFPPTPTVNSEVDPVTGQPIVSPAAGGGANTAAVQEQGLMMNG